MSQVFRVCGKHGLYEGGTCPKCKPEPDKKSKKYTSNIIIPPHMKAGGGKAND